MSALHLSVVIPAYNEEANIRRGTLDSVLDYLKKQSFSWEMVLVNDGSSDATAQLLKNFAKSKKNVQVLDNPHQGKAATVIAGARAAQGEIILFTDMDQATPMSEADKLLPRFNEGYQIVIGSRADRKGAPMFRQILALGMVTLRTVILRLPYKDTQCGFKAFSKDAGHKIFSVMHRLNPPVEIEGPAVNPGFDVELLYLGRKLGFKIAEVPVTWHYQESRRVRFVNDAISGVTGLLLVRWRSLLNTYGLD
jgi:dolichyl-phosphate beta-glucosyltransferase